MRRRRRLSLRPRRRGHDVAQQQPEHADSGNEFRIGHDQRARGRFLAGLRRTTGFADFRKGFLAAVFARRRGLRAAEDADVAFASLLLTSGLHPRDVVLERWSSK